MYFRYQQTLSSSCTIEGIGVHTGKLCQLTLSPAPVDHGLVFMIDGQAIPAHFSHVYDTTYATSITRNGHHLKLVEHLLAVFYGMGITNLMIEASSAELPILDGSALPFAKILQGVGLIKQSKETRWIKVLKEHKVSYQQRYIRISKGMPKITVAMPVGSSLQKHTFHAHDSFVDTIAPARTFAQLSDIESLQDAQLIKGGSLDNALVLEGTRPVNDGGFRMSDECARHKILDILGDFCMLGYRFYGQIHAFYPGHTLNHRMIQDMMHHDDMFEICSFSKLSDSVFVPSPISAVCP